MKAREAIEDALREIGVLGVDDAMEAEHIQHGVRRLARMLATWQNLGYMLWLRSSMTVTLTTAGDYALVPERPFRIFNANLVKSGVETPMQELTRQEYDDISLKGSTGIPTSWYYDRGRDTGRLYIYPKMATPTGYTVKITYERAFTLPTSPNDTVDVPVEWEHALVLSLAGELAPTYSRPAPAAAGGAVQLALSADREGSVFLFGDGEYWDYRA